jgi:hypothetical protein
MLPEGAKPPANFHFSFREYHRQPAHDAMDEAEKKRKLEVDTIT